MIQYYTDQLLGLSALSIFQPLGDTTATTMEKAERMMYFVCANKYHVTDYIKTPTPCLLCSMQLIFRILSNNKNIVAIPPVQSVF